MNPIAKKMFDIFGSEEALTDEATAGAKAAAKPGINDRASCRYIVPPKRQPCELKINANVVPASLENESNGGFAVLTDQLDGIKAGKKVELHVDKGWFTVRVVYVQEISDPLNTNPNRRRRSRLGLKKISGPLPS